VYPCIIRRKDLQRRVLAWTEDGERLRERAQESRVGLKEEVAKANRKLLRLQDLFEGGKAADEFYPGGIMIGAAEYDVLPRVASKPMCRMMRVGCARAYGDIFSSLAEAV